MFCAQFTPYFLSFLENGEETGLLNDLKTQLLVSFCTYFNLKISDEQKETVNVSRISFDFQINFLIFFKITSFLDPNGYENLSYSEKLAVEKKLVELDKTNNSTDKVLTTSQEIHQQTNKNMSLFEQLKVDCGLQKINKSE